MHGFDMNGDEIEWPTIMKVYDEVTGLSAGKWELEGIYNAIDYFEPAGAVRLNDKMFSEHTDATILYYNVAGEITGQEADAAVIVKRKDSSTTNSYTVTVNSQLSTSLITIEGVAAEVTDSKGTEYRIKNGPTFKATDAFSVNGDGAFTATGKGITVTKGSVSTAGKGTFTVNGIAFTAEEALIATPEGNNGIAVNKPITAGTTGKDYKVEDTLYKAVSEGVQLTSSEATLGKEGQSVTVNGHDTVTNNGTVPVEVSSQGAVKLAVGGNFKMGNTTYAVGNDITKEYVGTIEDYKEASGVVVTVNDGKSDKKYLVLANDFDRGAYITDEPGVEGELWNNAQEILPGKPVSVNSDLAPGSYDYDMLGMPTTDSTKIAIKVTKDSEGTTIELKAKTLLGVQLDSMKDPVIVKDNDTGTVYTLASNSHVTTKGNTTFTTTNGVVSDATGTLVLQSSSDSLTVKGTVNVDASALIVRKLMLRSMSFRTTNLLSVSSPNVTYQQGTPVEGAVLTLGDGKSLTITEKQNDTDTVYTAGALTGLDDGAEITTTGDLTGSELASVATATGGTFTVNGITFTATKALTVASVAETAKGTLTVNEAITAGTAEKNYQVAGTLYKSVSAGVALTSEEATLPGGKSVTVDGHEAVTNNGTVKFDVSKAGKILLAPGMNFTMGQTTYTVGAESIDGYIGTVENYEPKSGYVVTVTANGKETSYILTKDELSKGVTDNPTVQGELWTNDANEVTKNIRVPAIPITVDAKAESNSHMKAGFVTTEPDNTAATVTKNEDGTYAVVVKDKVLLGVEISGVTATLTDSGTETTYKAPGGSFQLSGTGTLDEKGLLTFDKARNSVTIGDYTYTLDKVNDKISLDTTGKLTSLTEGEKVTVTKGSDTFTYEVSGGVLLLTKNSSGTISTETNLLAEGEKDGFIIGAGNMYADNRATESGKAQSNTGLEVSMEGVGNVTDGMLIDRDGQATLSESKAIATVTINPDDSLTYTAKENRGQSIKVTAASNKEWDIKGSNR